MAKTFTFALSGDVGAKLKEVRRAAAKEGVEFRGDEDSGTFEGRISGTYRVQGDRIRIEVTKAPVLAPWSMIESRLRAFIEG